MSSRTFAMSSTLSSKYEPVPPLYCVCATHFFHLIRVRCCHCIVCTGGQGIWSPYVWAPNGRHARATAQFEPSFKRWQIARSVGPNASRHRREVNQRDESFKVKSKLTVFSIWIKDQRVMLVLPLPSAISAILSLNVSSIKDRYSLGGRRSLLPFFG